MARQRWKESGQRLAQLLAQLNPYWRVAEWTAMINHETDLLDAIVTGMKRRNYSAFVDTAPVCRRLAFDMSKYLYGGVEKQAFLKESLAKNFNSPRPVANQGDFQ
jgi:hypothetical protein